MIFDPDSDGMSKDIPTIDYLILQGAVEVAGIDDNTGEFLYVFSQKIKEVMPELYEQHMNYVNKEIMDMWENGFVNIDFLSESPTVSLTEKAFDEEEISGLSEEKQWSLREIKRMLYKRKF
jgi:hypothetical protein